MDLNYRKISNKSLFKDFEKNDLLNAEECQNYIPIYKNFFVLNENNYNNVNLDNKNYLYSVKKK